ncbi:MAG: hypothetical protein AB7K09_18105 [Planctomycetota bacterium]
MTRHDDSNTRGWMMLAAVLLVLVVAAVQVGWLLGGNTPTTAPPVGPVAPVARESANHNASTRSAHADDDDVVIVPDDNANTPGQSAGNAAASNAYGDPPAPASGGHGSVDRTVPALVWLSLHQGEPGAWSAMRFAEDAAGKVEGSYSGHDGTAGYGDDNVSGAVTGLALLAHLGCGYTHADGDRKNTVAAGLKFIKSQLHDEADDEAADIAGAIGDPYASWGMMSHALMTSALVENYGMTGATMFRAWLGKAVAFITRNQIKLADGTYSGWGRTLGDPTPDMLTTAWMLITLKSTQIAGEKVEQWDERMDGIAAWAATWPGNDLLTNAVVVLARNFHRKPTAASGDAAAVDAAARLAADMAERTARLQHALDEVDAKPIEPFAQYFSFLAMVQCRPGGWRETMQAVQKHLLAQQHHDPANGALYGSWDVDPGIAVAIGRPGMTALNSLMLEVYYRYETATR